LNLSALNLCQKRIFSQHKYRDALQAIQQLISATAAFQNRARPTKNTSQKHRDNIMFSKYFTMLTLSADSPMFV